MSDVLPPAPSPFASPPSPYPSQSQQGNGIAVAGLVCGILALVLCWVMGANFILGVLGIVFGAVGMAKAKRIGGKNRGMALAGLITGILGIVAGVVIFVMVMFLMKDVVHDFAKEGDRVMAEMQVMELANERFPLWAARHPAEACPSSIADLAETPSDRRDAWGHELKIVCGPTAPPGVHGLGVYSIGPDGIDGTGDDIKSWDITSVRRRH